MSSSLILVDANELRTAAFAAFLAPWACQFEADLHVVHDPEKLADLPVQTAAACLYSIGSLSLRDESVIQTIDRMRSLFPDSPVVVFSDRPDSLEIATAVRLGLRGFIPTTMPPHVGLAAIQFILSGGTYHPHSLADARPGTSTPPAMIRHIDQHRAKGAGGLAYSALTASPHRGAIKPVCVQQPYELSVINPVLEPLTKRRHIEVIEYLAQGETNKEIARHLNLTEATIKVYIRELMRHFGAKNRMQVILKASTLFEADTPETATIERFAERSII